jgi:hypothetical protein
VTSTQEIVKKKNKAKKRKIDINITRDAFSICRNMYTGLHNRNPISTRHFGVT